jgi:hypothetical protein
LNNFLTFKILLKKCDIFIAIHPEIKKKKDIQLQVVSYKKLYIYLLIKK